MSKYKLDTKGSWFNIDKLFDKKVELFLDSYLVPNDDKSIIKIGLVCEPQIISNNKNFYIDNQKKYDVILTFDDEILTKCSNAEMFEFGSCWIQNFDFSKEKKFEVSSVVGSKYYTEGHKLRHELWNNRHKITIPKNFYMSGNKPFNPTEDVKILGSEKNEMFESMFHIAIENNRSNNYFSEKIVDCFFSKTIPIYWGCPNIGNWFNLESIIIVENLEDMISKINNLNVEFYENLKHVIDENFEKSLEFLNFGERVYNKINEIINRDI